MKRVSKNELEALRKSGLFDEKWYLEQYTDVRMLGMDPLEHFLWLGKKLGRRPSLYFEGAGLVQGDEGSSVFLRHVGLEELPFDSTSQSSEARVQPKEPYSAPGIDNSYLAMRQDVEKSGLWDEQWYLSKYYFEYRKYLSEKEGKAHVSPLDHYLQEGWRLNYEPSDLLPVQVDQPKVGNNKVSYFLNNLRFKGYHFEKNIWTPSRRRIQEYIAQKEKRDSKKVIYTCIVDNYDNLMQPYYIENEWDYVCFTNNTELVEQKVIGVWEIRSLSSRSGGSAKANRWHKMHPHVLLPEFTESIYIDGNINIISDYIFKEIERRKVNILISQHFIRNCTYDEIQVLLQSSRFSDVEKRQFQRCHDFLTNEGFPRGFGLTENNVIYRRHNETDVVAMMKEWWVAFNEYPPRDQTTLAYVFWKNKVPISQHTFVNCRVNYRNFWMVKHNVTEAKLSNRIAARALSPAFEKNNIAAIFSTNEQFVSYLGVAIYSLIKNRNNEYNYDIIVLGNNLSVSAKIKLSSLAENARNVSIRYYDMGEIFSSLPKEIFHIEGYVPVETYNKCFITEILSGYDRCVYLDSDILILDDVQKLHDTPLEGCAIAASLNVANINAAYCGKEIKGRKFDYYLRNELSVVEQEKYFQAGVLVLDLKALRAMNLVEKSIDSLRQIKQPIFFDQCIFNRLFYGNVKFISTAWNHVWYMQNYSYLRGSVSDEVFFDYAHSRVAPKIIHYASQNKPHTKLGWKLGCLFWEYAYETPFIKEILVQLEEANNEVAKAMRSSGGGKDWYCVPPRLLVHIHLYYPDQFDVMLQALRNVTGCEYDLYVTIVDHDQKLEKRLLEACKDVKIIVVPNVGYDVYPFLHVLQQVRLAEFDFVMKLHTKNRRDPGQDSVYGINVPGYSWRDELINAVVGSEEIFSRNITSLLEDKQVGCLGAKRFVFSTTENREEENYKLPEWRKKCGVTTGQHYVGGSMFLARAYPFERLKALRMRPEEFKRSHMGTKDYKNTAHIFERLFGIVIENEGFEIRGV